MLNFQENQQLLHVEDNILLHEMVESLALAVNHALWCEMCNINFEQQCQVLQASPFIIEVWGNF